MVLGRPHGPQQGGSHASGVHGISGRRAS